MTLNLLNNLPRCISPRDSHFVWIPQLTPGPVLPILRKSTMTFWCLIQRPRSLYPTAHSAGCNAHNCHTFPDVHDRPLLVSLLLFSTFLF